MTAVHRDDLHTSVERLEYDFRHATGFLYMPKGCCTDMGGCIALFEAIDPKVRVIRTFANDVADTVYSKHDSG
jgi:hypothetical protein